MKRFLIGFAATLSYLALTGCAFEPADAEEDEPLAESLDELETTNALNANALNANALNANALNANALNANALNANALSPSALAAIETPGPDGDLARQLMKYVVSCALDPSQNFFFTWSDLDGTPHVENYVGQMGLEPSWAAQPLSEAGQRWISACLASRVNYYGVTVTISSRGDHPVLNQLATPLSETLAYTKPEGAFWGNLFSENPTVQACYYGPNRSYARGKKRDCAAGHPNGAVVESCGPINIVGDCATACGGLALGLYYDMCRSNSTVPFTDEVITVYLK